jgi:hypothetical protein
VYCVEGLHSSGVTDDTAVTSSQADQWLVRGLDPLTLAPQSAVALPARPRALAVAPDGDHAYALAGPSGLARTSPLVHLDLRLGAVRPLGSVPGSGAGGLAVSGGRLYVPDPEGDAVTVVDRYSGAHLPSVKTGRGPVSIAFGGG